jgi:hypothetical protein
VKLCSTIIAGGMPRAAATRIAAIDFLPTERVALLTEHIAPWLMEC